MSKDDPLDGRLLEHMVDLFAEYLAIWKRKQHDYGPENIGVFQDRGCLHRATDKIARLIGYYYKGKKLRNESVEDAWLDLLGYAAMGLLCFRGLWPKYDMTEMARELREWVKKE